MFLCACVNNMPVGKIKYKIIQIFRDISLKVSFRLQAVTECIAMNT